MARLRMLLIWGAECLIDLLWRLLKWLDGIDLPVPCCQDCGVELRPAYADRACMRNTASLWCSPPTEEPAAVARQMHDIFRTLAGLTETEWEEVERYLNAGAAIPEVMNGLVEWADAEARPWKTTVAARRKADEDGKGCH